MIVAEIFVTTGRFHEQKHAVPFTALDKATAEFERLAAILTKRNERGNDLPKTVDVDGAAGHRLTIGVDDISSIGLCDFAKANEESAGIKDTFPHLFKR